jgi:hypothetical protein
VSQNGTYFCYDCTLPNLFINGSQQQFVIHKSNGSASPITLPSMTPFADVLLIHCGSKCDDGPNTRTDRIDHHDSCIPLSVSTRKSVQHQNMEGTTFSTESENILFVWVVDGCIGVSHSHGVGLDLSSWTWRNKKGS